MASLRSPSTSSSAANYQPLHSVEDPRHLNFGSQPPVPAEENGNDAETSKLEWERYEMCESYLNYRIHSLPHDK